MEERTWRELSEAEKRELLDRVGAIVAIQPDIVQAIQNAAIPSAVRQLGAAITAWLEQWAEIARAVESANEVLRDMGADPEKDMGHWSFEDVFDLVAMARDTRAKYGAELRINFPKKRTRGRKRKMTDKDIERLREEIDRNPDKPLNVIAGLHGISYGTVYNYLKKI